MKFLLPISTTALLMLSACGGGGGSSSPGPTPTPTPTASAPSTGSTCVVGPLAPFNDPTPVTISGASVSGVDVNVGGPQACPTPNAQDLGTADLGAANIMAQNTGSQVHRNQSYIVILFGPGLTTVNNVSISGQPSDFVITNVVNRNARDGTPGVQFQIAVTPTAAVGARSVVLRSANNDTTVFTGGLEVLP